MRITQPGTTVTQSVAFLQRHRNWIYAQSWLTEYDQALRAIRRVLALTVGHRRSRPVGRCPSLTGDGAFCYGPLWPDPNGRMAVQCGKCRRDYDERFLRHLGGMIEQEDTPKINANGLSTPSS